MTAMSSTGTNAVWLCSIASEKCSRFNFAGLLMTTLRQLTTILRPAVPVTENVKAPDADCRGLIYFSAKVMKLLLLFVNTRLIVASESEPTIAFVSV